MCTKFPVIDKQIALYDVAEIIRRLAGNASDSNLEIVQTTDIKALLNRIPDCTTVAATGGKAMDTLLPQFDNMKKPKIGEYSEYLINGRLLRFYRMPSSSRRYPEKLENKTNHYRKMFRDWGFINKPQIN